MNVIETVKVKGEEVKIYRANNDVNGNPRFVIHFLDLGLKEYEATNATRKAGIRKYKGKDFGGGFWFYNSTGRLQTMVDWIVEKLEEVK